VDRTPSHISEEMRSTPTTADGTLWSPPLQHVWNALRDFPRVGDLAHGHWGLRWHGELKKTPRVSDVPDRDRVPGHMDSSALDQFVLNAPRYLDAGPGAIRWGHTYDWDAPKILANAGRLSRGCWRLAAAVDREGRRASQQFIAFWPVSNRADIDLDAVAALLNGPVVNAFLAEHSFDKRFRIRTLERAPVPKHIPETLGDLSRAYGAAARRADSRPEDLARLLAAVDALTLDADGLDADLRRDLLAAFGTNERPVRGASSRRRSRKPLVSAITSIFSVFGKPTVEADHGEELGVALSDEEAARQLRSIANVVPVEQWAGRALTETGLHDALAIRPADLAAWSSDGRVLGFVDEKGTALYPLEQFVRGTPVAGLNEIVADVGDARVAWLWLAIGLARTYRWGGHSCWSRPLSVAQHSLLVLALRQRASREYALTRGEALRELLHDADEGMLSFDPIAPLKPHLGADYRSLVDRLRDALATRYRLPAWDPTSYAAHMLARPRRGDDLLELRRQQPDLDADRVQVGLDRLRDVRERRRVLAVERDLEPALEPSLPHINARALPTFLAPRPGDGTSWELSPLALLHCVPP